MSSTSLRSALALFVFALGVGFSSALAATPAEEDIAHYIAVFRGDNAKHNEAVEELAWKGISDPALYDLLAQKIKDEAQAARSKRDDKNRVARYVRALGFSGQEKYRAQLESLRSDMVYVRYAELALADQPDYARWNPVIADLSRYDASLSADENRIVNMLRADDFLLKRIGAKRVYFTQPAPKVLAVLAEQVRAHYRLNDSRYSDAIAWMVKALERADGSRQYAALLTEVASGPDAKVARYARP